MFFMKAWDMKADVEAIRENAYRTATQAFKSNKCEIFHAWITVLYLLRTVQKNGILELEISLTNTHKKKDKIPFYHYLTEIITLVTDGTEMNLIFEVMTNDYYSRNTKKPEEVFILYLYIFFVRQMCCEGTRYPSTESLDSMTWEQILKLTLKIIPCEYREEFRKCVMKDSR